MPYRRVNEPYYSIRSDNSKPHIFMHAEMFFKNEQKSACFKGKNDIVATEGFCCGHAGPQESTFFQRVKLSELQDIRSLCFIAIKTREKSTLPGVWPPSVLLVCCCR